jgi:hypothetical protein
MDVVCDDALPSSHEYQEQVESKTAAMMRRICANLDKQKMSGSSKCKKLHVYLDSSEVLAECIAELWDSKMHSDMDKYEGLLQQLAFGVDIKKAMCIVELNAHLWGPVVMGFGPCSFGLAEPSGSYIGEKLETEGNKKELRNRREKGR